MSKKITKSELEKLYQTMTNKDLEKKLNLSHQGLIDLLKSAGIAMKGKGKRNYS